jgi:hypothetical protein
MLPYVVVEKNLTITEKFCPLFQNKAEPVEKIIEKRKYNLKLILP